MTRRHRCLSPLGARPHFAAAHSCPHSIPAALLTLMLMLAAAGSVCAQAAPSPSKRIGYLLMSPLAVPATPERMAFFDRLAELGYREGQNLEVIYRAADWQRARLEPLAQELVDHEVDLIVAVTSPAAGAAQQVTSRVPILFLPSSAPQADGLVESLSRPGANLTGVSLYAPELGAKRLDLLQEAYPDIQRVGLLWNSRNPSLNAQLDSSRDAAKTLDLKLELYDVSTTTRLGEAFTRMEQAPPDALVLLTDSRVDSYRELVATFGLRQRIPTMFGLRHYVEAGGLFSYGPDLERLFVRGAGLAARVLDGADPAELQVIQPKLFELVINLNTARALGRPIGASVLMRADEVIE